MQRIAAVLIALGLTGAAVAQEVVDADGNGTYSMEELMAAYPDLTEDIFVTVDANADGEVDADELAVAQAAGTLMQ